MKVHATSKPSTVVPGLRSKILPTSFTEVTTLVWNLREVEPQDEGGHGRNKSLTDREGHEDHGVVA